MNIFLKLVDTSILNEMINNPLMTNKIVDNI